MPDLQADLQAYFDEMAGRAERAAEQATRRQGHPRPVRLALLAACLAVAVGAVGLVASLRDDEPDQGVVTAPEDEAPSAGQGWEGEWSELPSEHAADFHSVLLRTDDGLLTIHPENGGNDVTGEVFRPSTAEVAELAPSGLEWRAFPAVAWTGTEVIVAGGSNGPGIDNFAAAYSPESDEWRALPNPPGLDLGISDNQLYPAVWTGAELIAWTQGLSFDPAVEQWSQIASSPLSPRADSAFVAMSGKVFEWGGCTPQPDYQCDEVIAGDELADGAIYDPATDAWELLPESPLGAGDDPVAVWTGQEIIVRVNAPADESTPSVAAYSPATNTWRALPDAPHAGGRGTAAAWTGDVLVLHGGLDANADRTGATTVLDPLGTTWHPGPDGPARAFHQAVTIAPGSVAFAGGAPASGLDLLALQGPTDVGAGAEISGTLADGREYTLRHDPLLRLCLDIDDPDFGPECDDSGAFGSDLDQYLPRALPDVHDPYELLVTYGYLPAGATDVEAELSDGTVVAGDAVIGGYPKMWAIALPPGEDGRGVPLVRYLDANGSVVGESGSPKTERSDFDKLTIRLEFDQTSVASGEVLTSTLVVENATSGTITDTGCRIGSGAYALVPADAPDAEAWLRPIVDCGGNFDMPPGFADRSEGPGFIASNKIGEALPPGEYLAVLDIDGRSERLSHPVTITE